MIIQSEPEKTSRKSNFGEKTQKMSDFDKKTFKHVRLWIMTFTPRRIMNHVFLHNASEFELQICQRVFFQGILAFKKPSLSQFLRKVDNFCVFRASIGSVILNSNFYIVSDFCLKISKPAR